MGLTALPREVHAAGAGSTAGMVSVSWGSLNVRSSASTGASVVTSLGKGSYVTLLSKSGDWWRVEYAKNKYGYCHADYITAVSGSSAARIATSYAPLNVRSGPGTGYAVRTSLPKGEIVVRLSTSGSWSRILYHGAKTGYVSSQYLSALSGSTSDNYSAISLAVPSYKQTDSRWANVKLGSSGKTIAQIGCATTAIAMMESYRTGTTIYPDAMSRRLSYTSGGSVYWPSHYQVVSSYSLSAIYELLRQGKPVLIGGKTAAGAQHWVVITGFTGGPRLSAAGFAIHDPGSNTRTNLQHFLNVYPVFYKYFHY